VRLALRELRRSPGRFGIAAAILALIALLLMFLGGLLDGLLASSTGAYRAQQADLIAYSGSARKSLPRSHIAPELREVAEATDGVTEVGAFGTLQVAARPGDDPSTRDLISTVLIGYQMAPAGLPADPPAEGTVIADSTITADGVREGDTLLLGATRTPVKVVGFVDDTQYSGQASLWGSIDTWRSVSEAVRPGTAGDTVQALLVRTSGASAPAVADRMEEASDGRLEVLTLADAIEAIPGVSQQRSTFNQIIGVTVVIAVVVVALFFALITLERTALYGVLKAIGASSGRLFVGIATQAVVVTIFAAVVGALVAGVVGLVIPAGSIPFALSAGRVAVSMAFLVVAALAGCAFSLRRVLRIDPAAAIGAA
jgi:putative ABC transport system permease protein